MSNTKESKDGWIRHRGGKCPVEGGMNVLVRMRDGQFTDNTQVVELDWSHDGDPGDIMAYRICGPVQQIDQVIAANVEKFNEQAELLYDPCAQGPLVWRDRIYELAAQQEEITDVYNRQSSEIAAERDSLIQRLESEGFRLIGQNVEPEKLEKWQRYAIDGMKINAIKEHRTLTGSGLKEAKDAVDAYQASRN